MVNKTFMFYSKVEVPANLQSLIHPSETIHIGVKTIRDVAVFTDKRILIADKQGITGKKIEYYSLPYKSIITYAIETAGTFDLDSEIKLQLSGGLTVELKFLKGKDMNDLLMEVYHLINNSIIA